MSTQAKLSKMQKFNYSLGDFSSNMLFSAVSYYFLYFVINVSGLSPFYASAIFIIAQCWDAVTDYLMGIICDRTVSRFGNRRVYMLFGAIPFGLFFSMLWIVPGTSVQLYKFIYYLSVYCLYYTIWTMVYIPYNSLLANLTDDYDDRTSLNGWRVTIANTGMILGAAIFPLLAEGRESVFYRLFGNERSAYFFASLLFGIISGALMFTCAYNIKERPHTVQARLTSPIKAVKQFLAMSEFRNTLLHYVLAMSSSDVVMGIFMFYLSDSLAITSPKLITFFLSLPFILSIFSATIWVRLSKLYSKTLIFSVAVVGIITVLLASLFIPEKGYVFLAIFCITEGFLMSAVQVLPFAAIPDVIEANEYYNGVRNEGSYFGIVQFSYNCFSGISLSIVSIILGIFGYIEAGPTTQVASFVQPESALLAIRGVLAFFPSILLAASIVFSRRINLGRERFNAIKQEIAMRKKL